MNMRHKNDLTSLSASDIGRVVSLEWDGYLGFAWYIEGTLANVSAEQQYVEDWNIASAEPQRIPSNVSYTVRVSGWDQWFDSWEAQHIIVSFPDLPVLDEDNEVN